MLININVFYSLDKYCTMMPLVEAVHLLFHSFHSQAKAEQQQRFSVPVLFAYIQNLIHRLLREIVETK